MKTVEVYYCNDCKALVFCYTESVTKYCSDTIVLDESGTAETVETIVNDSEGCPPECSECFTPLEIVVAIPIDVYKKIYASLCDDIFYIDLGDDPESILPEDLKEKITLAMMVNV